MYSGRCVGMASYLFGVFWHSRSLVKEATENGAELSPFYPLIEFYDATTSNPICMYHIAYLSLWR